MLHLTMLTLFGFILVLGQTSMTTLAVRPNLTLIIAIYAGQFYPPITGLILSFILGYFLDLMSGGLLGLNAFSMVSVCYLAFILSSRLVIQNLLTQLVVLFLFYLVYGGIIYLLFLFFNFEVSGLEYVGNILLEGLLASLLSIFVIFATKRMEKIFRFENERAETQGSIKI